MTADPVEVMRDAMAKARAAWFGVPMELTDERDELFAEYARAALAALDAAGLVVVPRVPNDKMEHVGGAAFDHPNVFMGGPSFVGKRTAKKLWAAMVTAAPTSAAKEPKP